MTRGGTKMRKPQAALRATPILILIKVSIITVATFLLERSNNFKSYITMFFKKKAITKNI
ncbi:hypothetical protein NUACC21_27130 [Scytonema sp. NUACC21]